MSTTVGARGRVTIEKEIREALGVRPGWRAIQSLDGGHVVIRFRPPKDHGSVSPAQCEAPLDGAEPRPAADEAARNAIRSLMMSGPSGRTRPKDWRRTVGSVDPASEVERVFEAGRRIRQRRSAPRRR